jgi:hypothetical protein
MIDASRLLGEDWWLVDAQAHDQTAPQAGPDLEVDSNVGRTAIRIPAAPKPGTSPALSIRSSTIGRSPAHDQAE